MGTVQVRHLATNPFGRLYDALIDPVRCERVMALILTGYAAAWGLYGAIAKSSQDAHYDMGEMVAWSHEVGLGTPKHPPLGAWLVRVWFSLMPRQDWSYYLFAMIWATLALWIIWRVSARYLTIEKRVLGIMLMTFVPFFNFHALKFNCNSVLIPLWAATTWWSLGAFETRRSGWAVLSGIGAAAAMLGKYWSIFLLAGLAVAFVADPRRSAYFRSPAPYITTAVGTILLGPHIAWLYVHDFAPFGYALTKYPASFSMAIASALHFLIDTVGYIMVPIALTYTAGCGGAAAFIDTSLPATAERRLVAVAFAVPLLLAVAAAVVLEDTISSLWSMSAMTLLPAVLLSSPLLVFSRATAIRILAVAIAFPFFMIAAAPAIALVIHHRGVPNYGAHYRLIADAVTHMWSETTTKPLRVIGSYSGVVNGVVFYFADPVSTFDIIEPKMTPWVNDARIEREGIAIVCPEPEAACLARMDAYAARYSVAQFKQVTLARRYFGTLDAPVRYWIAVIPPR